MQREDNEKTQQATEYVGTENSSDQNPCPSASSLAVDYRRPSRALQHVFTGAQKAKIVKWMIQKEGKKGEKNLSSMTVTAFPEYLRSSKHAALLKAARVWQNGNQVTDTGRTITLRGTVSTFTRVVGGRVKKVDLKALPGRGQKRVKWIDERHKDLSREFHRLRRLRVQFNLRTLRDLAENPINVSENSFYHAGMYHPGK